MQKKIGLYFVVLLLLLMGLVIGIALTFPYIESKLLPLLLAGVIFVLVAVQLRRELRAKGRVVSPEKQPEQAGRDEAQVWRRFGVGLSWIVGFFVVLYLAGFLVAMLLFVFLYLKLHRRGWLIAIACAVLTTLLMYGVFDIALKTVLFRGILLQ